MLLLVDMQNDFLPGGALADADGDRVVPVVNGHDQILWPPHCVEGTEGAAFAPGLDTGLGQVAAVALAANASAHLPRTGCGLASGDWTGFEAIIFRQFSVRDVPVTICEIPTS